ncbi:MAG: cytochrome c biogenesis protein CcsA [Sphaerospermopsis sp. SIO1G2]|nr:cytochrome c biogenesis protein CcsA [Sphaerospermopsis sp. SIO1G2]
MLLPKFTKRAYLFNIIAFVGLVVALGMIFFYAPNERTMGYVQRLFYFHVGSAWVASITFSVALVCGAIYLWKPQPHLDALSLASVEIGVVFIMMTIISGSVWGKPAWNTWWLWSPRLTSITILWLVYIAYFMLRGALDDVEKKRRFSAVYVIAAFVTVIITYGSIRILRDIHPIMFGGALESAQGAEQGLQEFSGLDSLRMVVTLNVTVLAFSLLYVAWLANRIRIEGMKNMSQQAKMRLIAKFADGR